MPVSAEPLFQEAPDEFHGVAQLRYRMAFKAAFQRYHSVVVGVGQRAQPGHEIQMTASRVQPVRVCQMDMSDRVAGSSSSTARSCPGVQYMVRGAEGSRPGLPSRRRYRR